MYLLRIVPFWTSVIDESISYVGLSAVPSKILPYAHPDLSKWQHLERE